MHASRVCCATHTLCGHNNATQHPQCCIDCAGSTSGVLNTSALTQQSDNTWVSKLVPRREETLAIVLFVDNTTSASVTVVIAGRSLALLAYNASLAAATLLSQGMAATTPVRSGGLLLSYAGEPSLLTLPLMDTGGSAYVTCAAFSGLGQTVLHVSPHMIFLATVLWIF
jgi:hypothetical protein